jgi:hypothetical protein
MVQIDFSNAFGSVPHDLILSSMTAMGIPTTVTELVRNICTDNSSKIQLIGSDTPLIPWASGTVQGCPLSPTLFNICLESFLRRIEKPTLLNLGYTVQVEGGDIKINAAAYADDLILYTETHEDMQTLIRHLEAFCKYANMKVNADKCVSISRIWSPTKHAEADMNLFWIKGENGYDQVAMEMVSIYLGIPIGFDSYENSKQGREVLANMLEDVRVPQN